MIYVLIEPKFKNYPWCHRAVRGLYEETRKKRMAVSEIGKMEMIPREDETACVLLLGATEHWINRQIRQSQELGTHPIVLASRQSSPQDGIFSSVVMDVRDSMQLAIEYLRNLGCMKLALYGVNPASASDPWRASVFKRLIGENGAIFTNQSNFQQMYKDFSQVMGDFDGAICANDYAAVSLVRHMRSSRDLKLEEFPVLSYGNTFLSRKFSPTITSISDNYEYFGKAAIWIYNMIVKEKIISAVNIQIRSQLYVRESTGNRPYIPSGRPMQEVKGILENLFYEDEEIASMAKLELLLNQCDDTDFEIMQCLIQNDSYMMISEKCFISETAVKYRIKKMETVCGVKSREKLSAFFKEFLG